MLRMFYFNFNFGSIRYFPLLWGFMSIYIYEFQKLHVIFFWPSVWETCVTYWHNCNKHINTRRYPIKVWMQKKKSVHASLPLYWEDRLRQVERQLTSLPAKRAGYCRKLQQFIAEIMDYGIWHGKLWASWRAWRHRKVPANKTSTNLGCVCSFFSSDVK